MKAYQLCPICGHIVPTDKVKEHYALNILFPFAWQKIYRANIKRTLTLTSFVEGNCFDELTFGNYDSWLSKPQDPKTGDK